MRNKFVGITRTPATELLEALKDAEQWLVSDGTIYPDSQYTGERNRLIAKIRSTIQKAEAKLGEIRYEK